MGDIVSEKYTLQCKDVDGVWRDTTSAANKVSLEKAREEMVVFDEILKEKPQYFKVTGQRIVKITTEVVE
jgi:hypothetical protein